MYLVRPADAILKATPIPYWLVKATNDTQAANMAYSLEVAKVFIETHPCGKRRHVEVQLPCMRNIKAIKEGEQLWLKSTDKLQPGCVGDHVQAPVRKRAKQT